MTDESQQVTYSEDYGWEEEADELDDNEESDAIEDNVAEEEQQSSTDDFADEEEVEARELTDPQEFFDNEEDEGDDEEVSISECGRQSSSYLFFLSHCCNHSSFGSLLFKFILITIYIHIYNLYI